jgi:hypothetical protein
VLSEIANLARTVDDSQEPYHANVMRHYSILPANISVKFETGAANSGYLAVDVELSSVSRQPLAWDSGLEAFALAIPAEAKQGRRWLVLPGAPKAFATRQASHVPDTTELRTWFEREARFPVPVVDAVVEYFSEAGIGGFASKRLLAIDGEPSKWVLNVHRGPTGLLSGQEKVFFALVAPLEHLLLQVLERHEAGNSVKTVDRPVAPG